MHLHYAEIVQLIEEDGERFGKIRVGGALKKVPLELLTNVECGDKVLLCDGVAISKVQRDADTEKDYVPRNSR